MKLLAIDTSSTVASFAVSTGSTHFQEQQVGAREHATHILPIIERLLSKAELDIRGLDGIVFGRGPGSFTGLRVACSVAKALAYSHDLPVYPVSSLAAIAFQVLNQADSSDDLHCLSMIDARMGQVYWGVFSNLEEEGVVEHVTNPEQVLVRQNAPLILAGVGFENYQHAFTKTLQNQIQKNVIINPDAWHMIQMVEKGYVKPISAKDAMPVYIRNQVTHGGNNG